MGYKSKNMLAFTPQNPIGKKVLNYALFFSKALQTRIFALDIHKQSDFFSSRFQSKKAEMVKNDAKQKLASFIEKTIEEKLPENIIPRIQFGDLFTTLIKESQKGGYNFVVIDKDESILKKARLNKFINRSYCPVLVTGKDSTIEKIKKIIIPIDISQKTKKRLLWATAFAKKFDANIQIISALNKDIDETKSLAYKNAESIKKMLHERNVKCDIKILKVHKQPSHKVILEYIEKKDPDLVIIRTHQESIFSSARIGQFVSEIIQNCKMPVFTVGHTTSSSTPEFED